MVASVAGTLEGGRISRARPFRAPHHSASMAALTGGGHRARPGEVSLAHLGVLFLDELPEFQRAVLDSLRQPLETGRVDVARANAHVSYPARVQLVAAMNPCRCGHLGDPALACSARAQMRGRLPVARLGPAARPDRPACRGRPGERGRPGAAAADGRARPRWRRGWRSRGDARWRAACAPMPSSRATRSRSMRPRSRMRARCCCRRLRRCGSRPAATRGFCGFRARWRTLRARRISAASTWPRRLSYRRQAPRA